MKAIMVVPCSRPELNHLQPGALRAGEAFLAHPLTPDRRKGDGKAVTTASPWLSGGPETHLGRARAAGNPGPRFPPRNRSGPDTTTAAPPPMSAPAGGTHRAGVCQTRHEVGPAPPITSATSAIHPRGAAPAGGEHVCHWTAAHHDNVGQRRC